MKYRSRLEISVLILEAAEGGASKSKIMYKSFLSYAQLKEYFTMLIENDALEYEESTQNYRTTKKGMKITKGFRQLEAELPTTKNSSKTGPLGSKRDAVSLILEAAEGGATKTKIMYKSFLDYPELKKYLSRLIEKDLLKYDNESGKYRTTDKGLATVQSREQLKFSTSTQKEPF